MKRRAFLELIASLPIVGRFVHGQAVVDVAAEPAARVSEVIDLGPSPTGYVQCLVEFSTPPDEDIELYLVPSEWNGDIINGQFVGRTGDGARLFCFEAMENQRLVCQGGKPEVDLRQLEIKLV